MQCHIWFSWEVTSIWTSSLTNERSAEGILGEFTKKGIWEESTAGPSERHRVSKLLDLYVAIELARLIPSIGGRPAVIVDVVALGFLQIGSF
jgi:hypothetical protein